MNTAVITSSEFKNIPNEPEIRYRMVTYVDQTFGDECTDFEFQIFKKPYLWGLLGKKKWDMSIQTNSFSMGLSFSKHLLGNNKQTIAS